MDKNKAIRNLLIIFFIIDLFPQSIYIIPPEGFKALQFIDLSDKVFNRDDCLKPYFDLFYAFKKLGLEVFITPIEGDYDFNKAHYIICFNGLFDRVSTVLKNVQQEKIFVYQLEPHVVLPHCYKNLNSYKFSKIFLLCDGLSKSNKYVQFFFPQPHLYMVKNVIPFNKKHFCTLISGNKSSHICGELYSERLCAMNYFSHRNNSFKFFGIGWPNHRNYGGKVENKVDVLKYFKFCICYENCNNQSGYITEKIFDCFHAGCVPIYYGAPNITTYIPANCFIDFREFENYESLNEFLELITEQEYEEYLKNIRAFLSSDKAFKFSTTFFIDQLLTTIFSNYDRSKIFDANTVRRLSQTLMP